MRRIIIEIITTVTLLFVPVFCLADTADTKTQRVSLQIIMQELQLFRLEVVSSHIDSLTLMLESVQNNIEEPTTDPSLIEKRIGEVEKLISLPNDPASLESYKKELNELLEDKASLIKRIGKLRQREEKIRLRIAAERDKLRSLQTTMGGGEAKQFKPMFSVDEE